MMLFKFAKKFYTLHEILIEALRGYVNKDYCYTETYLEQCRVCIDIMYEGMLLKQTEFDKIRSEIRKLKHINFIKTHKSWFLRG